jgi:hypothetical protein
MCPFPENARKPVHREDVVVDGLAGAGKDGGLAVWAASPGQRPVVVGFAGLGSSGGLVAGHRRRPKYYHHIYGYLLRWPFRTG